MFNGEIQLSLAFDAQTESYLYWILKNILSISKNFLKEYVMLWKIL